MADRAHPVRRVLVADDEPLARARLLRLLAERDGYVVVAECEDGEQTLDAITACRPDIVLLDIEMPELDGVAVARAAHTVEHAAPAIVFVTAFDQYALDAIDEGATDYLLKPVTADKLDRALTRAERWLGSPSPTETAEVAARRATTRDSAWPTRIAVRDAKGIYFVRVTDLHWAQADGNYIKLHMGDGARPHLIRDTVTAFTARLDPRRFVRVHRSIVVQIDGIARLEPHTHGAYTITMRDGARFSASRAYSAPLRALAR